jgi:hypothetical protein
MILLCAMTQAQTTTPTTTTPPAEATAPPSMWHYGIKADFNLSNVVGTGMKSTFVAGGQIGGFVVANMNKKWELQGEVLISLDQSKRGYDFGTYFNATANAFSNETIKLTYLNVPILFRYKVAPQFSIVAGPQVSFLINDDEDLLKYNQRAFKTYAISGNLGAEYNMNNVALYARYNLGISDIDDADAGYPNRYRWAAQHIMLGIAIRFK